MPTQQIVGMTSAVGAYTSIVGVGESARSHACIAKGEQLPDLSFRYSYTSNSLHLAKPIVPSVNFTSSRADNQKEIAQKYTIRKATQHHTEGRQSRTLVVIFGFYGASERAITNYCSLYHRYGFDAMYVRSFLKHFAWPKNSIELASDVLSFIGKSCENYDNIVVHAFSMGAYNFTVCIDEMYSKPERYADIQRKIKAVVYDSLTIGSLKNMARGVGLGISRNRVIQTIIPLSMSLYFRLTYPYTIKLYDHYVALFKQKPLEVPTLLYCCRNDPMSEYDVIEVMVADWKRRFRFDLVCKSWDKSKHSAHLLQHKEDYTQTLDGFIKSIPGLVKIDSKV